MKKAFTVHDLPQTERPRERLATHGPEALSLHELLAIVLSRGTAGESVMTIAQNIFSHFGSLEELSNASLEDLQKIKGLGFAKACQLKATLELGRRIENGNATMKKSKSLISPQEIYELLKSKLARYAKEHFVVLSFDSRNQLLGMDTVSVGTLNASLVHPRETFECAIKRHAASIVIAHNHPSGNTEPSDDDLKVTSKLVESGKLLGINILDHIIFGKDNYFSFSREKYLQ